MVKLIRGFTRAIAPPHHNETITLTFEIFRAIENLGNASTAAVTRKGGQGGNAGEKARIDRTSFQGGRAEASETKAKLSQICELHKLPNGQTLASLASPSPTSSTRSSVK